MATYNSSYTGAQLDASIAKSQAIGTASVINSAINKIEANQAADGQVLTANGSGSSTWQTPASGAIYFRINHNTGELIDATFNDLSSAFSAGKAVFLYTGSSLAEIGTIYTALSVADANTKIRFINTTLNLITTLYYLSSSTPTKETTQIRNMYRHRIAAAADNYFTVFSTSGSAYTQMSSIFSAYKAGKVILGNVTAGGALFTNLTCAILNINYNTSTQKYSVFYYNGTGIDYMVFDTITDTVTQL